MGWTGDTVMTDTKDAPPKENAAMPPWMNPNNIPPWMYFVLLLGGGSGATALNFFGDNDAKTDDIIRLEQKVESLDAKVEAFDKKQDEILEKFTELRILIARYHAN